MKHLLTLRETSAADIRYLLDTATAFKEILAVSDQPQIYTAPFRTRITSPMLTSLYTAGLPTIVSVVTPSLLFDELTLQRPSGEIPNLPFTEHPSFEK